MTCNDVTLIAEAITGTGELLAVVITAIALVWVLFK